MARGMNRMQPFVVYSYVSGEIARELGDIPLLGNHVMDMTLENMADEGSRLWVSKPWKTKCV